MCAVNGSLWTLKVEEGFYVVLPIIFYLMTKTKKSIWLLVLLYIGSLLYYDYFLNTINKPLLAKQLPGYISYFSVGIFLYLKFNYFFKYRYYFLFLGTIGFFVTREIPLPYLYPLAFGVFVIAISYTMTFLNDFGKYGDFTYGIYISHFPIIQIFRQFNLFEKHNPYLMSFFVIILSFLFAVFSWNLIEKRFLDRYKTV
jgi:peptidoglycan/LPS O-acetylase OafA/YrhL